MRTDLDKKTMYTNGQNPAKLIGPPKAYATLLSPLAAHLNESLTSLRFATKVNNTTIGTAKKVQVQNGKS
ncbi:hypothetical protein FB451DRAFT_1394002 [Mycena latifolia]|nr:hypothetical protein FB451DRAFT_1394002 [Mycena latifolia]